MQVQSMFARDIDRNINGVIKVEQDDEAEIKQELTEYVVTRELQRHFDDFYTVYAKALDVPTEKIGVWITGFFGSGKSHFLKMLSYLLSNRVVDGKPAIRYFDGKIDNPMVFADMERAAAVPTDAILFNIDNEAGQWKEGDYAKTAVIRAFESVFHKHLGFYGEKTGVAHLEEDLADQGAYEAFKEAYQDVRGRSWEDDRKHFGMRRDAVVKALVRATGSTEEAAVAAFESARSNDTVSIEQLTDEIKRYVDRRAEENGGRYRLLFMVDEIGQFIGNDPNNSADLMLSLQSIVEALGAKCRGKVWVMVTSQESIDHKAKQVGLDFSKIQGRFDTKLNLSSSSVDEVIKRRLLDKTPEATAFLDAEYQQKRAVLKNLFTFDGNAQSDLIGYSGEGDFVESYPFVNYQFKVLPNIFNEIREHGNAGKHLASGERSMLSGFQESAQQVEKGDDTTLVPLWRFYDTLSKSLDHDIRQVIDRAQRAAEEGHGLEQDDVNVLKTLYLIHYIKDVSGTIDNLAILMVESIDADKVALRESVTASLDRLMRENYVGRSGDVYSFLTNEAQDVEREIKNTEVDSSLIINRIARLIFEGIYPKKRYRLGHNDFAFDAYVDGIPYGTSQNGMKLCIVTNASELSSASSEELGVRSGGQALVVLQADEDYYEVLNNAARIEKYVRTQNTSQLPETKQTIIAGKNREARKADGDATRILERAIVNARVAINGSVVTTIREGKASAFLDEVLRQLASVIYSKAQLVDTPAGGVQDIRNILVGAGQVAIAGANEGATDDLARYLAAQALTHSKTKLGDIVRRYRGIPYGWSDYDIEAMVARLVVAQQVSLSYGGANLTAEDPRTFKCLTTSREWDATEVRRREPVSENLLRTARELLRATDRLAEVPKDEDGLVRSIRESLQRLQSSCEKLLQGEYSRHDEYPGRETVVEAINLSKEVLSHDKDATDFLRSYTRHGDDFEDLAEDLTRVNNFFPQQQRIFDRALATIELMRDEEVYFSGDEDVLKNLETVKKIVKMPEPYRYIKDLNTPLDAIERAHHKRLFERQSELLKRIEEGEQRIRAYAADKEGGQRAIANLGTEMLTRRGKVHDATTLTQLDAQGSQLTNFVDAQIGAIDDAAAEAARRRAARQEWPGQATQTSHVPTPTVSKVVLPRVYTLQRSDVCPSYTLHNEEEINRYVEAIRGKLLDAIKDGGSVRLKG